MTEDTSPENLRKFLENDDPAMVRRMRWRWLCYRIMWLGSWILFWRIERRWIRFEGISKQ